MFTGIVETTSRIKALSPHTIMIQKPLEFDDLKAGDSLSVNGVCLTITGVNVDITLNVVAETLRRTTLGRLSIGEAVNLERAFAFNGRMGGHYVQGHIDDVGKIIALQPDGENALLVKITCPPALSKYIVSKGFIALDGMSVTVIESRSAWFTVTFIPYTITHTVVKNYRVNMEINIETDILAKHVEKLLDHHLDHHRL